MMDTLMLIILAVSLHYALDYLDEMNKIDCPSYCEVDHKHVISKEKKGEKKCQDLEV